MISCDFFSKVSRKKFLDIYWRKRPLLIKGGVHGLDRLLNKRSILQLAARADTTSRLVSRKGSVQTWDMQFGPFKQSALASLPKENWTVLVQEVDHHLRELEPLRTHFQITPQWLFDDIMVSFATDNGGVGPHFDQYDVFLIQGFGNRRWQIGDPCDESTELVEGLPLKILKEFRPTMEWLCEPGDVLYLPPMIPHHGVAVGECSTYSVGFRSLSSRELFENLIEQMAPLFNNEPIKLDVSAKSSGRAEIKASDFEKLRDAMVDILMMPGALEGVIGSSLTTNRRELEVAQWKSDSPKPQRSGKKRVVVCPHVRLVYLKQLKYGYRFYAEGMEIIVPKKLQKIVMELFDRRYLDLNDGETSKNTLRFLRQELKPLIDHDIVLIE